MDEIKSKIDADLNSRKISGKILLDRFSVIDDSSRKTSAYLSSNYSQFYYYLGKYVQPKFVMEIGFNLGLLSSCFLTSCKTVEFFLGFSEKSKEFNSFRLGKRNIRSVFKKDTKYHSGTLLDKELDDIKFDLIIINEEVNYDKHLDYLEFAWKHLNEHGIIVAEYIEKHIPAKEAFFAFCESKNREGACFKTRYGSGLTQR